MSSKIIGITTGDTNGIGLEVTYKALEQLRNSKSQFILFRSRKKQLACWKPLPKKMVASVGDIEEALELANRPSSPKVIEFHSDETPAHWVKQAAHLCLEEKMAGMVTGPISKRTFLEAGFNSLGHTPLLKEICKVKEAYMGFLGKKFSVILLSGHMPLKRIEASLSRKQLKRALDTVIQWQSTLPKRLQVGPLGVLGLNPHAGEGGLLGSFETKTLRPLLKDYPTVRGPLVPDAAFIKNNWRAYSFYLALYHDQGLIPFKMIHGHDGGAHVTVGLPIIRTSVDHGTAVDIFGKGLANPSSMVDAIRWCETLTAKKKG